jgi:hypothetical protein
MNRTTGQKEIDATCSKLPFHLLLCLFSESPKLPNISVFFTSKPSPGESILKAIFQDHLQNWLGLKLEQERAFILGPQNEV